MTEEERAESAEARRLQEKEIEEDTVSVINNCGYFGDFMENLKVRGGDDLTGESVEAIKKMRRDMEAFLKITEESEMYEVKVNEVKSEEKDPKEKVEEKGPGVIPKRQDKSYSKKGKAVMSSEEKSSSESSDSSDSAGSEDEEWAKKQRKKSKERDSRRSMYEKSKRRERSRYRETQRNDSLPDYLRKMDNRQVPKLEKYREEAGMSLLKYLDKFERYCLENFRGSEDFWASELESHLEGTILNTYQHLKDQDDDYYDIKDKLVEYYQEDAYQRKRRYKRKFRKARPESGESLYLFSIRLAKIFRLLYPKKFDKNTKKLVRQFKRVIPNADRESLDVQLRYYRMEGRKLS